MINSTKAPALTLEKLIDLKDEIDKITAAGPINSGAYSDFLIDYNLLKFHFPKIKKRKLKGKWLK